MNLKSLLDEGIDMESYHISPFCFEETGPSDEGIERIINAMKPGLNRIIACKIIAYYFYHKGRKDGFEYIKHYYDKGELDEVKNEGE